MWRSAVAAVDYMVNYPLVVKCVYSKIGITPFLRGHLKYTKLSLDVVLSVVADSWAQVRIVNLEIMLSE